MKKVPDTLISLFEPPGATTLRIADASVGIGLYGCNPDRGNELVALRLPSFSASTVEQVCGVLGDAMIGWSGRHVTCTFQTPAEECSVSCSGWVDNDSVVAGED